ncbi:hypothetical protein [Methylobacter sp. BlB1]|jgi:hypothetical protein|uniref:hypothetical protein n=1 Tax=Methylobacter sp. BlB1 TaxID=2785914 RepID=UPI00189639A8|nr:hypothetical protein [Methylobacter sp. BlB1]MBF6649150.1 hypothetical protein [Methylobacter sp. BlB1]
MSKQLSFSDARKIINCRDLWSARLAHVARTLIIATCIGAWVLVGVSIYNDGPSLALAIVAIFASLFGIPIYVIANASITGRRVSTTLA